MEFDNINVVDAHDITDTLDDMEYELEQASIEQASIINERAQTIVDTLDNATLSGDSPLVVVDRARSIRERSFLMSLGLGAREDKKPEPAQVSSATFNRFSRIAGRCSS